MNINYKFLQFSHPIFSYFIIVVVGALSLRFGWTGFVASDDEFYAAAGIGWLEQFPYVAQHFGSVRASIGIPIALMISMFGESEFSITLSTILFLIMSAGLTMFMLSPLVGKSAALLASSMLVTVPVFVLKATTPCADIPELFYVISSFVFFWQACWSEKRNILLLLSGIFVGLAFSAHELSSALLLFYGLLFLLSYLWIALGFTTVIATECVYYWIAAGNPAHRFMLLLQGFAGSHDRKHVAIFQIGGGGTLHIWEPIDPIVMLLTHHSFGILGWFSIPAIWWLVVNQRQNNQSKSIALARLALGLAATWLIFNTVMLREIVVLPRYYMVTAYFLFLICAIWASNELWLKRRKSLVVILVVALLTNLLFISIDNKNPKFAERTLVKYLEQSQNEIYTDPLTASDSYWFCRWAHVDCGNRIIVGNPNKNGFYFWNPKNTNKPNRLIPEDKVALYQPKPSWKNVSTIEEKSRPIVVLLQFLGLKNFIPEKIWLKLSKPNPAVYIYVIDEF
jgi:4-amino-4-deoxy-L-arabinose transferase-like glycosyltransferase